MKPHGAGQKQVLPNGDLRFPFNPGPPTGKYPGWRHRRKVRTGRRRGMAQQVEGRVAIGWQMLQAISRGLRLSPQKAPRGE